MSGQGRNVSPERSMQVHFEPANQRGMTDARIAKISLGDSEGGVGVSCDN